LELERDHITFFPLSWTIVHPITEESPLLNKPLEELQENDAEILVLLMGYDETFSQTVHTRSSYKYSEIEWGARFGNIYEAVKDQPLSIKMDELSNFDDADLPDIRNER
jgi:inward rectifier potassium channel